MTKLTIEETNQRVDELQSQVKKLRLLSVVLIFVIFVGSPIIDNLLSKEVIKAKTIEILSKDNKKSITITSDNNGSGLIRLRNGSESIALNLAVTDNGYGTIEVLDHHQDVIASFGSINDHPGLVFFNESNKANLILASDENNHGLIKVGNNQGISVVDMLVSSDGSGVLNTYTSTGAKAVRLTSTDNNNGAIETYNNLKNNIVLISADSEGNGGILTYNKDGKIQKK